MATETENLTIEILKQIRDEIKSTRTELSAKIDQTNVRLDQTNSRIDQTNVRLEHVEGAVLDLAEQQRFLVRNAKRSQEHDREMRADVDELRRRVDDLDDRVPPKS